MRSGRRPFRSTEAKQPWKPSRETTSLGRFWYMLGPKPPTKRSPGETDKNCFYCQPLAGGGLVVGYLSLNNGKIHLILKLLSITCCCHTLMRQSYGLWNISGNMKMMISYFQALAQRVQKKPCGEKDKHLQANLSAAADRDLALAQEDLHE